MKDMKLLEVVTPLSIYDYCSTQKTLCGGNFTQANMKNCGRQNFRKHREIKNGDQYIVLDVYLKFGDFDKMKITYSEPKYYFGRSDMGLIIYLGQGH